MSGKLGMFVLVSVCLTMVLFLYQLSIDKIAEEEGIADITNIGFNYNESNIKQFDSGDYTLDASIEDTVQSLPTEDNSGDIGEDGNWFTDTFKSVKNWLLDVTGIKYVLDVLNAFPNFLTHLLPKEVAFALGYLWNAATIFALIFWIKGGGS